MKNYWKQSISILLCSLSVICYANNTVENQQEKAILSSIYENVILKDSQQAKQSCQRFLSDLENNKDQTLYQQDFKNLVLNWKKVETNYIAPDMDSDMQDIPVYLDVFHLGNENIPESVLRTLKKEQPANIALFKNAYKTFSALEAVLYTKEQWSDRRYQFTKEIVSSMCDYFNEIDAFYTTHKQDFVADVNNSIGMIINRLTAQSFKLKDWRLGDPAGLTSKYKHNPDPMRGEYPLSGLSIEAGKAIIQAQLSLIGQQPYANFATLLKARKLEKAAQEANNQLTQILNGLNQLKDFDAEKIKPIMLDLAHLHFTYYTTILSQLPVEGKILEADGD
ncbi:imelysin family protein [Pasteurella skyensis]|uniref:imelysin family protein n=1 Tax=Phocoenobacter skyensis TaxID=97481 RepID=UPI00276A0188|nr:imelysin family protein [Pasteurella skyensis]MDP8177744.1 imelysin family protein [Pasteurella skyensis]MDP8200369.1 imelysin family protein [Pasteurella skyensis]